MTSIPWEIWVVVGIVTLAAYMFQAVRWLRVLQREDFRPGCLRHFYFQWAFPPSVSANAIDHHRSLSSRVLSAPFQQANRVVDRRTAPTGSLPTSTGDRFTKKPLSLPLVMAVIGVLALVSRSDPMFFLVAVIYGMVFPWGMALRGRRVPLRWDLTVSLTFVLSLTCAVAFDGLALVAGHASFFFAADIIAAPIFLRLGAVVACPIALPRRRRAMRTFMTSRGLHSVVITTSVHATPMKKLLRGVLGEPSIEGPEITDTLSGVARWSHSATMEDASTIVFSANPAARHDLERAIDVAQPDVVIVSRLTAVDLELAGSLDRLIENVARATSHATTIVLHHDDPAAASLAEGLRTANIRVVMAGSTTSADVSVMGSGDLWTLHVAGSKVGDFPAVTGLTSPEVACVIAAARVLGMPVNDVVGTLRKMDTDVRASRVSVTPANVTVMVDVRDIGPLTAKDSLASFMALPVDGDRYVVTPGFVRLGPDSGPENFTLGATIETAGAQLVAIGRTNAENLISGYGRTAKRFDTRADATAWIQRTLRPGDGVLYLNDLEDHYP